MREQCGECRFWWPQGDEGKPVRLGECCRYPPAVLAEPPDKDGLVDGFNWRPEVGATDWCGEFRPGRHPHRPADSGPRVPLL